MANNPFDPPIVQVKKSLERGGLGTVNRGFGSTKSSGTRTRSAPNNIPAQGAEALDELIDVDTAGVADGQGLVWDEASGQWVPSDVAVEIDDLTDVDTTTTPPDVGDVLSWTGTQWEPDALTFTLDDLTDVDTTSVAPVDGQALVYNAIAGVWEPGTVSGGGGGGPTVGAWDYNVTATFTAPLPIEVDMQGAPMPMVAGRPGTPTFEFTVGPEHIITCDDPDLTFQNRLGLYYAIDHSTITSGGTVNYEVWVNDIFQVSNGDSGGTATEWHGVYAPVPDAKLGDNVKVYIWGSTGSTIKWRGMRAQPTRPGYSTAGPGGMTYLYTSVVLSSLSGTWTPATVLAKPFVLSVGNWDTYEGPVNNNSSGGNPHNMVVPTEHGLYRLETTDNNSPSGAVSESVTGPVLYQDNYPRVLTFHRLPIPVPSP